MYPRFCKISSIEKWSFHDENANCAECGITKTQFVKQSGNGLARRRGRAYYDTVASTGADLLIHHGIPWLGNKSC